MKTALIVIDAQKIYTSLKFSLYCRDSKGTIERINELIERFQRHTDPLVYVRHIHKTDGTDLGRMFDYTGVPDDDFNFKERSEEVEYDERLIRPKGAIEIVKTRYSSFQGTTLHQHLKSLGVGCLVICGFMTNFCCESTARDAHDLDYFVDFITDATGTPGIETLNEREIRTIVGKLLEAGFARVSTTRNYLKTIGK